jgi:hypothetical protein
LDANQRGAALTTSIARSRTDSPRIRFAKLFLVAGIIALISAQGAERAEAAKPEKVFRGQIITSNKRIPTRAKSPGAYIAKLKKSKKKRFMEDKEKKRWKIYFAAFFRHKLNDLEVTVKLYDVTNGAKHLVNSFEQYLSGRGQTSVISNVVLEREYFGVNKDILMVMESRGKILATGRFQILGEAEKYKGSVDFTED